MAAKKRSGRSIRVLNHRTFSPSDAVSEVTPTGINISTDIAKRHRLVMVSLGKFGRKGVQNVEMLTTYLNAKAKGDVYGVNHITHSLHQLRKAGCVEFSVAQSCWRLTSKGADIFAKVKFIKVN